MPKGARYPLFLLGLLIIIIGELGAQIINAPASVDIAIGVIGFTFLILSIAIN
jgi:hypothetical protein